MADMLSKPLMILVEKLVISKLVKMGFSKANAKIWLNCLNKDGFNVFIEYPFALEISDPLLGKKKRLGDIRIEEMDKGFRVFLSNDIGTVEITAQKFVSIIENAQGFIKKG